MINILFSAPEANDIFSNKIPLNKPRANINFQDSRGWTTLMIASTQGSDDMVEFLLQNGADIDLKDKYGKKAADKAKTQSIFYILSSAAMDKRMKLSKEQFLKMSPEKSLDDETIKHYNTEPNRNTISSKTNKVSNHI
jgi:ankyrin repeat protein